MKAVFVIISFALLLFIQQTSAEETKDASVSREVRAADAGKKESRLRKKKKQCKGKKCQKRLREKARQAGKGKGKKKCRKGKNCRRGKKGEGRRAKGKKGKEGKKKMGGRGRKGKGGKGGKGKKGKGRKRKNGKGGKGKAGKGKNKGPGRNAGKQSSVPAKCSANTCTATDNVDLFNKYKKNDNMLRQLQRLVRFYDLITKKGASALTTFEPAAGAIEAATSDCTKCVSSDTSITTAAIGNCTILKNCSVSAPAICNINGITYEKIKKDCINDGDTCPAGSNLESQCGTACPAPSPPGPPDCSDACKSSQGNVAALTPEDKTFAETCIPIIKNWTKTYRDCNAGDTFGCQQSGCNKLKGECNLKNCRCDTPDRTCDFEECVDAKNPDGKDYKDFVCNTCLKSLEEKLVIPSKCAAIAKYERAVFARKEECIRKEKTGSFGDCASSQKAITSMIIPCMGEQSDGSGAGTTTMAPTGRLLALKNKNMIFKNKKQFF